MALDINEYREKTIKEIEDFIKTADVESYELTEAFEEHSKNNPGGIDFSSKTWRVYISDSDNAVSIDKYKGWIFSIVNNLAKMKRDKKAEEKKDEDQRRQENADWWKNYYKENSDYWQKSSQWWKDYNNKKYDWQKDDKKKKEENERIFNQSDKKDDLERKKEFITDIEMDLTKKNITDERLSKRLNVSDWKDKIRQADGFNQALSMRGHLWDIIRKLEDEYTCANCGVKKEEWTVYKVGSKKCCSYECEKALKDKDGGNKSPESKDDKKNDDNSTETEPKRKMKKSFGFSDIGEFFAWMKKMGVSELKFDTNTNQLVIKLNSGKKLDIEKSGLTKKQQEELTEQARKNPITYSEVSNQVGKGDNENKGGNSKTGIIAAIVIVGIIFTVIVSIVIYNSRKKKDY